MLASKELCINKTDQESRARVTSMMIAFAKYGHIDGSEIENSRCPTPKPCAHSFSKDTHVFLDIAKFGNAFQSGRLR